MRRMRKVNEIQSGVDFHLGLGQLFCWKYKNMRELGQNVIPQKDKGTETSKNSWVSLGSA